MKTAEKNWKLVKKNLKDFMEGVRYNAWVSDLKLVKFDKDSGSLYLEVPTDVIRSQLESRYRDMIVNYAKEVFENLQTVLFLLPEEVEQLTKGGSSREEKDFYPDENMLNPRYTFDTFIVGENNRFAHNAALAVAEAAASPRIAYNPLFIYGGSGLGKTHLMCAIGHYIIEHSPKLKVLYVSSETFTNDFVTATMENYQSRSERMNAFKSKYRNTDVLMIDDIQFIEEKERTIEEVFHTYNTLYNTGKQLIFSSDRPPGELLGKDVRLQSRLASGLIVDLQPPSFEIKVAILRKKAMLENIPTTDGLLEVIDVIAEKIKTNIREMEGAFNRVVAFSTLSGDSVNKAMARRILRDIFSARDVQPTPEAIKKSVARFYDIKISDLESAKRAREFSFPRQIAMFLCREMTDLSLPKIGEVFGKRDHTTVLHACEKISKEKINDENLSLILKELEDGIRNN
jgi:chromosomal replication initiator protein